MNSALSPTDFLKKTASTVSRRAEARSTLWITVLAFIAFVIKIMIAFNTFGSNDVATFYIFARSLSEHGLAWTYHNGVVFAPGSPLFNHPPLTAYYLRLIDGLAHQQGFRDCGLTFPFLLRLPGIIADFVTVLFVLRISTSDERFRIPIWALALLAISPVSIMISGFHGNTDSVMVMFLVLASFACLRNRPLLCGLLLALSSQVKIVPLLFFPIFFLFWFSRRKTLLFFVPFAVAFLTLSWEPVFTFPILFIKNVLSYGSFWGIWGLTYWLRMTGYPELGVVNFYNLPPWESFIITLLKGLIVGAVLVIAWRRRKLDGYGLVHSIAYAWIIFFVFSPGVSAQYMVWLAPFILVLSPTFYAYLVASSSLFLFFFYNITAGGLPWYLSVSRQNLNTLWTPWSLWPWAVLLLGLVYLWKRAVATDPSLRLCSLETLREQL
jgi:Gpi18-like mannosyltransferase